MAGKRDMALGNIRCSQEEDVWIRSEACAMGMDVSELVRKCLAIGIPRMRGNSFMRRVELQDAMSDKSCK